MTDESESTDVHQLSYHYSTHAPLLERYMGGEFQAVGEQGQYGRVHPDTGAKFKALGGRDHCYSKDFNIGPSYKVTGFFKARDPHGRSVSHDVLREFLEKHGFWSERMQPVVLPKGIEDGVPTWYEAFQISPPSYARRPKDVEAAMIRAVRSHCNERETWDDGEDVEYLVVNSGGGVVEGSFPRTP